MIDIPSFTFRVEEGEVESYRRALGAPGGRVPLGMALRALATDACLSNLRQAAGGRHPVHVAQQYSVQRTLRAGVDYVCQIRVRRVGEDRLRIEQCLRDDQGQACLTLASDVALVTTT